MRGSRLVQLDERIKLIDTALGRIPADLAIKGANLVNVCTGEVYKTDIAVKGKRIALVGDISRLVGADTKVLNVGGLYAIPGLIDSHMHVESTMLTLSGFAEVVLPRGVTSVLVDPHEIANVLGMKGISLVINEAKKLPLKVYVEVPSRVPTAPGLETTGASIGVKEVADMLTWDEAVSLGEINSQHVLAKEKDYLLKIASAREKGKPINGHAAGLTGEALNAFVAAGAGDDHECVRLEEALEKLRLGIWVMLREGSTERNLLDLLKLLTEKKVSFGRCLFCTDDKHPLDLVNEGHMDYIIRLAVKNGLNPITAVQIATINCAERFHLDEEIGSISPGRLADIVLVDNLELLNVKFVVANGLVVAKDGKLLVKLDKYKYPLWAKKTVHLKRSVKPNDFEVAVKRNLGTVKVRAIGLIEDQIMKEARVETLSVDKGHIMPSLEKDVIKIAVVERHHKTGNIGLGFVHGFGLKSGALGSTVAHDHHNIVVVGVNGRDLATAVNALAKLGGGFIVVKDGKVLESLPLPIAGLMTEASVVEVCKKLEALHAAARTLECPLKSPFMSLSFVTLPTVPELGLTDLGLIDVRSNRLIEVVIS